MVFTAQIVNLPRLSLRKRDAPTLNVGQDKHGGFHMSLNKYAVGLLALSLAMTQMGCQPDKDKVKLTQDEYNTLLRARKNGAAAQKFIDETREQMRHNAEMLKMSDAHQADATEKLKVVTEKEEQIKAALALQDKREKELASLAESLSQTKINLDGIQAQLTERKAELDKQSEGNESLKITLAGERAQIDLQLADIASQKTDLETQKKGLEESIVMARASFADENQYAMFDAILNNTSYPFYVSIIGTTTYGAVDGARKMINGLNKKSAYGDSQKLYPLAENIASAMASDRGGKRTEVTDKYVIQGSPRDVKSAYIKIKELLGKKALIIVRPIASLKVKGKMTVLSKKGEKLAELVLPTISSDKGLDLGSKEVQNPADVLFGSACAYVTGPCLKVMKERGLLNAPAELIGFEADGTAKEPVASTAIEVLRSHVKRSYDAADFLLKNEGKVEQNRSDVEVYEKGKWNPLVTNEFVAVRTMKAEEVNSIQNIVITFDVVLTDSMAAYGQIPFDPQYVSKDPEKELYGNQLAIQDGDEINFVLPLAKVTPIVMSQPTSNRATLDLMAEMIEGLK